MRRDGAVLKRLKHWFAAAAPDPRGRPEPGSAARAPGAAESIEAALAAAPDDVGLNYRVGLMRLEEGDAAAALDYFHLALHYAPDLFPACAARARALHALGRSADTALAYREFLRANPGHAGAAYALAAWHHARGEHAPAIALLRPLADRRPVQREACNLLGLILGRELGRLDEGERLLRLALEADPQWPVALSNLGWILLEKGDSEAGLRLLDAALERDPLDHETRLMRSYMNLKRGEFEQGWRDFAARLHSRYAAQRSYPYAAWDGGAIPERTLLVCGEQGLGDQIMFASCLHETIERAGHCIVECDPKLVKLFQRSFANASVYAQQAVGERPAWSERAQEISRQIPLGSLPGLFRNGWEQFPQHAGYLRAAPERVAFWRARLAELGPGPKIGLSWRGGVPATRRGLRSLAPAQLAPLLRLRGCFVSLQYGDYGDDLSALSREHGIALPHWQEAIDDYDETAALVCALDLVISVCTAVIHLAGALARPVWVLVPAVAEWRYLDRGERMPWYPSARLMRQAESGRWAELIERVRAEFEALAPSAQGGRD